MFPGFILGEGVGAVAPSQIHNGRLRQGVREVHQMRSAASLGTSSNGRTNYFDASTSLSRSRESRPGGGTPGRGSHHRVDAEQADIAQNEWKHGADQISR
jgi:hypothetical protein